MSRTIKKELQAYYAKQGLTGKHLRKALQYDMKAVRREGRRPYRVTSLCHAFDWIATPQGVDYWHNRWMGNGQ
jgi:hypothetical protein